MKSWIYLLCMVGWISVLNALPTRVFVKNETKETQIISGEVENTATQFATGSSTVKFSIGIAPGEERELEAFEPSLLGSMTSATVTFAGNPVDLGNYTISRVVIFRKDGKVLTRVEQAPKYTVARMAMARWWSRTQNSWSSYWQKLFGRKTR